MEADELTFAISCYMLMKNCNTNSLLLAKIAFTGMRESGSLRWEKQMVHLLLAFDSEAKYLVWETQETC